MKKILVFILCLTFLFLSLSAWEDEELFYQGVKPNIMILFDNSGSMNMIIFHPDYSPGDGHGSFYSSWGNRSSSRWIARWIEGTSAYNDNSNTRINGKSGENNIRVDSNGRKYLEVGEWIIKTDGSAVAKIKSKTISGSYAWLELEKRHGTFNTGNYLEIHRSYNSTCRVVKIFGDRDNGNPVRYDSDYEQWLYLNATEQQREEVSYFCDHGTFDMDDSNYYTDTRMRIRVARKSVTGIIDGFSDTVKMGLFNFNTDDGGRLRSTIKDLGIGSNATNLKNTVNNQVASTWTPLAESLAEIWRYYQGANSFYPNNPGTHTSPCDLWCRENFVIVMTDGEPTQDTMEYSGIDPLRGDWDEDGDDPGSYASSGTDYLDDVAKYMYDHDARPDLETDQNVQTFTIGFTTAGQANTLLNNTAINGHGDFYTANNYDQLLQAFQDILFQIMEQSTSFSPMSAPKQSLASGSRGYIATFVPKNVASLWQGHLKCFKLEDNGDFHLAPDGEPIETDGWMYWDAAVQLNSRTDTGTGGSFPATSSGDRTIFTWIDGAREMFIKTNTDISQSDLGVASAGERNNIFDVIRGTTDPNGFGYKLGDTFHFNPLIVSIPIKWKGAMDASYKDFYDYYSGDANGSYPGNTPREEVAYLGANDGMLHCFRISDGEELWAFIPSAGLKKLNNIATNNSHDYFVDGKAIVKDVKISNNGDYTDWRTIIVFGMGIGGKSYYAIDVTDPTNPSYLWSIGIATHGVNTDKSVLITRTTETVISNDKLFGLTMDKPAIGVINTGSGKLSACVLSGGYDRDENLGSTDPQGKSIYILNAYTGVTLKGFKYNGSNSNSATLWQDPNFLYSMPSAPIMIDLQNDGVSDSVYQGDIGGLMWKIDISNSDSTFWQPEAIFNTQGIITNGSSSQGIYISPTIGYDASYNLWVFFGTGKRAIPNDQSNIGKFLSFKDDGSNPVGGYLASELQDISTYVEHNQDNTDTDDDGYSDAQENSEGTDPLDEHDYPASDPWTDPLQITSTHGFLFDFFHGVGEKLFEPTPIYMGNTIYFSTYLPSDDTMSGDETCDPAGDMFIYQFELSVSAPNTFIGSLGIESGRIVGSGVLTGGKYKIYTGNGEIGSTGLGDSKDVDLSGIFGPMFWIENKSQ